MMNDRRDKQLEEERGASHALIAIVVGLLAYMGLKIDGYASVAIAFAVWFFVRWRTGSKF